jgi:hypothetical protein
METWAVTAHTGNGASPPSLPGTLAGSRKAKLALRWGVRGESPSQAWGQQGQVTCGRGRWGLSPHLPQEDAGQHLPAHSSFGLWVLNSRAMVSVLRTVVEWPDLNYGGHRFIGGGSLGSPGIS